jgi:ATP-dependent Lon protease
MVMVGNFDVDVEHQQRIGHLLTPLPPEMRDDTAFMDRLHAYLPGWDVPKMRPELFTEHFGLVSDFLSECWSQLRNQSRLNHLQGKVHWGGALSGRDQNAANKTASGLLKLLHPGVDQVPSDEDIEWAVRLALECRRRVKEQQKRIGAAEYRNTHFSYTLGNDGIEKFVATPEVHSDTTIGDEPLEPGQVWALSPGSEEETPGLFRVEVTVGPGSGLRILNNPAPRPFKESANFAIQNLYSRAVQLVGDKDPRGHEFSVQVRAFDAARGGAQVGVATLVALCSALLGKPIRGGLALIGEINLGGSIELVANPVELAEIAAEKGAKALLVPVSARRQMVELSDDLATKLDVEYYKDAQDALLKALVA